MVVAPDVWPVGPMTGLVLAVIVPLAATSARHFSSRPGAAGEFRARASRARSQIERAVLAVVPGGALTLPKALTGGVSPAAPAARHWASRPGAAGEFRARASRARSQIDRAVLGVGVVPGG